MSLVEPLFLSRYAIGSVPALAILVALGTARVADRSRAAGVAVVALIVALAALARVDLADERKEDLRAAARDIAAAARPGDGIAYAPAFARVGVSWYLRSVVDRATPRDFALAPGGSPEQVGDLYARELPPERVAAELRRHQRVWLAGYPGSTWHPTPEPVLAAGLPVLRAEYRLARSHAHRGITVHLYERRVRSRGRG